MSSDLQPLASFTFQVRPTPCREIGTAGELAWLDLSKLFIDPTYQRAILDSGKANIRRMIEQFSWLEFGTVVVGVRGGGRYAIIDGQHRATAAKLHGGITKVPCLILRGGPKDEARAFSAINGNITRIHPLQSFRAKVAAGDATAAALVSMCAEAGVTIAAYPKPDLAAGETMALGTLQRVKNRFGDQSLVTSLKFLRAAEPGTGLGAAAILGIADALEKQKEWRSAPVKFGRMLVDRGGITKLSEQAIKRKVSYGGAEWVNFSAVVALAIASAQRTAGIPMSRLMGSR